jgi:hypothetical protein
MEEVIRIVAFDPEMEGARVTVRISGSGVPAVFEGAEVRGASTL